MQQSDLKDFSAAVDRPWSVRVADSVIVRHTPAAARWHYEHGLVWQAIEAVWHKTGEERYLQFVKSTVDQFIDPEGSVWSYRLQELNLDQIKPGTLLLSLFALTQDDRYRKAASLLRDQLNQQPRTASGGFWHKQIYPNQMWLDGLFMAAPFYARYARDFNEPAAFDDIVAQFMLVEQHTRDEQTGLLYHAWDESRQMRWADPLSGCSPHFWSRAMGWYLMALVDVLEYLPAGHPGREKMVAALNRAVQALANVQDGPSGLWYQVLDQGGRAGNYHEASGSAMYVYAIARGVRLGYLQESNLPVAERGFRGLLQHLVTVDERGLVNLDQICGACGLGGNPYRDGSYEYYVNERVVRNDYKGVGALILAAIEMEQITTNSK